MEGTAQCGNLLPDGTAAPRTGEPEHIPEFARNCAEMVLQLHRTECVSSEIPDIRDFYGGQIRQNPYASKRHKDIGLEFLQSLPNCNTCLHGDLHFGNIITDGK